MARSRRTTPSAQTSVPASTAPAGRSMRSRGEAPEAAPSRAATQQATTRRSARAKSVESTTSVASRASRTRRRVDEPKEIHQVDLTTLDEGSDNEDIDLELPPPDEVPEVRAPPGEEADEAVGDRSLNSMSGTTALDHQSDDEDEELNPHLLLAHGPAVYRAAADLINRFDQHKPILLQILRGIDRVDSSTEVGFHKDVEALQDAALQLGDLFGGGAGLVNPDDVMEGLFKQSLPNMTSECWRVMELMQLFNLAIIVRTLAGASAETDEMTEKLRLLDVQFPFPILKNLNMSEDSPQIVGNSYLQEETFDAALAIRLQATVMEIQRSYGSDDFDAAELIQTMFYALPGRQDTLRAWDVNSLGSGDLGLLPEFETKMRRRIKRLVNAFEDDSQEIAEGSEEGLQVLTRNFPWIEFRAVVLRWAKLRMEEITSSIDAAGGVEKLMDEVRAELSKDSSFDPNFTVLPRRSPAKQKLRANTRNESRQTSLAMATPSPLRRKSGNTRRTHVVHDDEDNDGAVVQPVDEVEIAKDPEVLDLMIDKYDEDQRQRKENIRQQPGTTASPARRRQFVDEQEDAERISQFDEGTQAGPSQQRRHLTAPAVHENRKRKQIAAEDDVSDDEGFQSDTREVDMSQRRRDAPRPHPSPKRVRIREPGSSRPDLAVHRTAGEEEDERVREYAEQSNMMRSQAARAVLASTRRPRPQMGRIRWDAASELRLEELVAEHGISWAYLKTIDQENGDLFAGRDQVALKDKARNMKAQFILNGIDPLPRNWEFVPLDKKAVARLLSSRVEVERLIAAGVGLGQLCQAGAHVQDLADAGVSKLLLRRNGFSDQQLEGVTFPERIR